MNRQHTRKRPSRSRRKAPVEPRGRVVAVDSQGDAPSVQILLPLPSLLGEIRVRLEELATEAGRLIMRALLQDEVEQKAGERYGRGESRRAIRWGQEEGYVVFAGKKVPLHRPRLRDRDGREVELERYRAFQRDGHLEDAVANRVVRGVSMRDYRGTVDDLAEGYGIEKSSVSRHWKAISARQLSELLAFRLDTLRLAAVMIDGIEFRGNLVVVALGISHSGKKHVLGLWQGATENTTVCRELLGNLIDRGLDPRRKYLFVLDGSKAIRKAIVSYFGEDVPIQRCLKHKERNILDHLPKEYHRGVRQRLRAAWDLREYDTAKRELQKVVHYLRDLSPSAAASLEEGFEDSLTLHRLGVPEDLRRSLRTTNSIESCFSMTRRLCRNVKRWRSAGMVLRWSATMLLEAEKRFRRIKGHRSMPVLLLKLAQAVDEKRKVG